MTKILSVPPPWIEDMLRSLRRGIYSILYRGNTRWCPVCGKSSSKFRASGSPRRQDARCIHCDALERHRFVWLFFQRMTDLFDGKSKTILHVAPERCFESRFRKNFGNDYITADLFDRHVMVRMDITAIPYPDNSFDVIYCSHVLEHVSDDKKALREFYRTLKPNGWAVLLVPITATKTFEDPSIENPAERLKYFGQDDHLRQYGPDFIERVAEAGLKIKALSVSDIVDKDTATRMGLTSESGNIYYCTKK
jgi:SAM-dependent methyltransferase